MARLEREEFFNRIRERIGDDTSDGALKFMEDITDTYDELEGRVRGDGEDWKAKYEELDAEWRKRYRDRFFNTPEGAKEDQEEDVKRDGEKTRTFEELFEEREGE